MYKQQIGDYILTELKPTYIVLIKFSNYQQVIATFTSRQHAFQACIDAMEGFMNKICTVWRYNTQYMIPYFNPLIVQTDGYDASAYIYHHSFSSTFTVSCTYESGEHTLLSLELHELPKVPLK
jgi:hypothetical protein